jgi:hypothetical protein
MSEASRSRSFSLMHSSIDFDFGSLRNRRYGERSWIRGKRRIKRSILSVVGGIMKCDKGRTTSIPTNLRMMLLVLGDAGTFTAKGTGRCHVQGKYRSGVIHRRPSLDFLLHTFRHNSESNTVKFDPNQARTNLIANQNRPKGAPFSILVYNLAFISK